MSFVVLTVELCPYVTNVLTTALTTKERTAMTLISASA